MSEQTQPRDAIGRYGETLKEGLYEEFVEPPEPAAEQDPAQAAIAALQDFDGDFAGDVSRDPAWQDAVDTARFTARGRGEETPTEQLREYVATLLDERSPAERAVAQGAFAALGLRRHLPARTYDTLTAPLRRHGITLHPDDADLTVAGEVPPARVHKDALRDFFGEPIYRYTVENALADGSMERMDPTLARQAGYNLPVVMTRQAHETLVAWDEDDPRAQDETGRAWDVLMMGRAAAKAAASKPGERVRAQMVVVPRHTASGARSTAQTAKRTEFDVLVQGMDAQGRPCLTFLLPDED